VPLPDRAVEGRLRIDLELVHVEPVGAQQLHARLDQARMARQAREGLVPGLHIEGRSRGVGALLAHDLGSIRRQQAGNLAVEDAHLLGSKQAGQEQIALLIELGDLGGRQFHRLSPRAEYLC